MELPRPIERVLDRVRSIELPRPVLRLVERIQMWSERVGIAIQRVVLTVMLTLIYTIGVGLTRLYARMVSRQHLGLYEGPNAAATYWKDAEGYTPDREQLHKQF
ncbi:MAG: hypothetical protein EXR69_11950 [Myxococcales bacterium]|nr:hypothetical protein [Myxococcales bacterium]